MVKPINHNIMSLRRKASPIKKTDKDVAELVQDLRDTLKAHHEECVGMAGNMIGQNRAAIIVSVGPFDMVMLNPEIIEASEPYETEEGCLSLNGLRSTTRYHKITVRFDTPDFQEQIQEFTDWTAQIIQHECDHLKGVII